MSYSALSSFEGLRDWFIRENKPFWTLYDGKEKRHLIASNMGQSAITEIEMSYQRLQTELQNRSQFGCSFWIGARPTNDVKNVSGMSETAFSIYAGSPFSQQIAGIGSVQQQPTVNIDEAIAKARKEWDLEQKISSLEERLNSEPEQDFLGKANNFINGILGNPVVAALAAKIMGINLGDVATIAGQHKPDDELPLQESDDLDTALELFNQVGISDKDLLNLAKYAKNDPTTAKNLLQQISK